MSKVSISVDKSGSFRVYLTDTTDLVQKAQDIHVTTPLATAGLGRVLTGAGIMSLLLKKSEDRLTVLFKGDGPAEQIVAVGGGDGMVKGYIANPDVDLPLTEAGKLDVGGSLGIGELTVIRDLGLKEPYSGTIALVSGEIAEDLTAYYYISEQQNTAFALGVKIGTDGRVAAAGGMFIQMLPDAVEGAVDALEGLLSRVPSITSCIEAAREKAGPVSGWDSEGYLEVLKDVVFEGMPDDYYPKTLEYRTIDWYCGCSKERMAKALMTVGAKELTTILKEDGQAELSCQFCRSKYLFTGKELREMIYALAGTKE